MASRVQYARHFRASEQSHTLQKIDNQQYQDHQDQHPGHVDSHQILRPLIVVSQPMHSAFHRRSM
jgi:hypothetical protein